MSGILKVKNPSVGQTAAASSTATAAAPALHPIVGKTIAQLGLPQNLVSAAPSYTLQMPEKEALDNALASVFLSVFKNPIVDLISDYTFPLSPFVNFSDRNIVRKYLAPEFQSNTHVVMATGIAKRIYEIPPTRWIGPDGNLGIAYSMHPEILAHAMELAREENVLEIAGARGENATLLAFGGAKNVYMNDLDPTETATFCSNRATLPENVGARLKAIEGDCLDILQKKPNIARKIGLVLCRNLIHFHSQQEQREFFQLLKKILKPGGRAIFTVQTLPSLDFKRVSQENPDATCFSTIRAYLEDTATSPTPTQTLLYMTFRICPDAQFHVSHHTDIIHTKDPNKTKWEAHKKIFAQQLEIVQQGINRAVVANKAKLKSMTTGYIKVWHANIRFFTKENLRKLFVSQGFEVELTFATRTNGHLLRNDEIDMAVSVGVIARLMD
jgi:SAM-dependent methyltransferase